MTARIEAEAAFLRGEFETGGLDRLLAVVRSRGRGATRAGLPGAGRRRRAPGGRDARLCRTCGRAGRSFAVPEAHEDGGRPERVRALVSDLGGGLLLAVGDDLGRDRRRWRRRSPPPSGGRSGLAALLGIGGGVLLSRAFLARVDAISRTAEAIIGGDLARRVPVRGTGDDLDRLAATLNRMLDRIGALMDSLHQVSSDVAHDLRTPLSRLYQRLEDARTHARSVGDYEAAVDGRDARGGGAAGHLLRPAADRPGGGRVAPRRVPPGGPERGGRGGRRRLPAGRRGRRPASSPPRWRPASPSTATRSC